MSEFITSLAFSDIAAAKIAELIAEDGNAELKLRIAVSGGGCSGFKYDFCFDDTAADDDYRIDKNGVCVLVDAISMQFLTGAEIDYEDSLEGARFLIKNIQASSTCGCGSSFSV
ncbi:MAG: iron-sulfur cluster insertion protein ErpA [Telluria sp.]|nr:iron-sulfur cluster insertion protein ErpA [Telluria sp.]